MLIAGAGVAFLLSARSPRINLIECLCLAWLFGIGAISLLLWVGGFFVSGVPLQGLVAAFAIGLGLVGWKVARSSGAKFELPRPASRLEWILFSVLTIEVAVIFYASSRCILGWDGLLVWEIKARYAFLTNGVLPTHYFSDSGRGFSHPDYPLALPFAQLWIYLWLGEANQFWAKIIFPIFYAVGAVFLGILTTRITGHRWLGYLAAILLFFVPQVTVEIGSVLYGYADFPLGVFYLAAIGYLISSIGGQRPGDYSIFAACLTLLPWIKKEGTILWAVAALAAIFLIFAEHKSSRRLLALLPGLLLIGAWKAFLASIHVAQSTDFAGFSFALLKSNLTRLVPIHHLLFSEMTTMDHWGIFWLLPLVACVYLAHRGRDPRFVVLAAAWLVPILIYSLAYVFSAWDRYLDHVASSIARLLIQVVPVAWLAIAAAFADATKKQIGAKKEDEKVAAAPSIARPETALCQAEQI